MQSTDRGVLRLADYLSLNPALTRLDLRGNQVGNRGAAALARALRQNTRLLQLDLSNNAISQKGMPGVR